MDPFDEFEFKPLTDGLGFHKKKEATAPTTSEKSTFEPLLKDQGLSLLEEESVDALLPPLPRKKSRSNLEITQTENPTSAAVDEILKTLQQNKRLDFENGKEALKTPAAKEEFQKTTWNFSATFLDSMLVIAASLLCMIILLVVTRVDLIANLTHPDSDGFIYMATASLFLGVNFIYMLTNRVFMGCTPGEWAFDQRIGTPKDMQNVSYSLRVAARVLLNIATGFILFPIISTVMNKDILGQLTGASLYKKA